MAQYAFPAFITKEDDGYIVKFPDIDGCYTDGNSLDEAIKNAKDVLCLMLYDAEETSGKIPMPSDLDKLIVPHSTTTVMVECDTEDYRRYYKNKNSL